MRKEVAEVLGIEPATWSGYVSRGQAPAPVRHVGRTPLWDRSEVMAWHEGRAGRGRTGSVPSSAAPQRLVITPREAAALHRLLDAYLGSTRDDPGVADLDRVMRKVGRLTHDHSVYDGL